ncbi:hypothetical protein PASm1_14170 [Pasteurella multocida]|nr:hypothetical protein PASm1_14170 [Pasteurella multocida]
MLDSRQDSQAQANAQANAQAPQNNAYANAKAGKPVQQADSLKMIAYLFKVKKKMRKIIQISESSAMSSDPYGHLWD